MGLKFNKEKEHGTVYGSPGIAYEHNGVQFGFDGEVYSDAPVEPTRSEVMKAAWAKRKKNDLENHGPAM